MDDILSAGSSITNSSINPFMDYHDQSDWDFLLMTCTNQRWSSGQVYGGPYQETSETPKDNTENLLMIKYMLST